MTMSAGCNVACELLQPNVAMRPHRAAIICGDEQLTWAQLAEQVDRMGNLLLACGLRRRESVVLKLPDEPLCIAAFLGAIKAGLWPILVSPDASAATLEFILDDSQAAVLVTRRDDVSNQVRSSWLRRVLWVDNSDFAEVLAAVSATLAPAVTLADDIAFFLYTSGSTGKPKGVPHRHRDMLFSANSYGARILQSTDRDIHFSASKLFFAYGLGNSLFLPFRFGAATVLHPGKSTPQEVFRILREYRPSVFFGVPGLYSMLLKSWPEDASFDSLRLCVSAGEALPASLCQEWQRRTGVEVLDGIGSTEALHIFISNIPGRVQPGASGFVVPPYEAKIVTEEGKPACPGQPGTLWIRGGSTATYYWNLPEETRETMSPDDWLRTGDIYVCRDDVFAYQGRADDMFKVDAHWVAPAQVESVLQSHVAVRECAVSWRRLEQLIRPVAYVVLNAGVTPDSDLELLLRRYVRDRLPDYMCPVQVEFCAVLPRTDTGKLQRFRLRSPDVSRPLTDGSAGQSCAGESLKAVTHEDLVAVMIRAGISRQVIAELKFDQPLVDQGLESMDLPALAAAAEKRFGVNLFDAQAMDLNTLDDFVAYINGQLCVRSQS
jgi:benzoate-CoA ligase